MRGCFVTQDLIASTCPGVTEAEIDTSSPPLVCAGPAMEGCPKSPLILLTEMLGASLARLEPVACAEMTRAGR